MSARAHDEPTAVDSDSFSSKDSIPGPVSTQRSPMNLISRSETDNLRKIATNQSKKSRRRSSVHANTDIHASDAFPEDDPSLDPQAAEFDLERWLRAAMADAEGRGFETSQGGGILFRDLNVSGSGAALQLQATVGSLLSAPLRIPELLRQRRSPPRRILNSFNGLMKTGELLLVLGRPGAGCSTFLKTLCGETNGLDIDSSSALHYNGVSQQRMMKEFKGEVVYNQEVDKHFPHLTVGQTLEFAAAARTPSNRLRDMTRDESAKYVAQVVMAIFGLSHTYNTKVGDDFVRGVSGGERKRVSIAEMALAATPFGAWDNSSRGLDSATALKFIEALRLLADLAGTAHVVAIYQASQSIYEVFDKVTVLYEGRQIFFGPTSKAKSFFERQGWECPSRQTTGDFLTSVTNPQERRAREGMKDVPQTPEDFERYWRESPEYKELQTEMGEFEKVHPPGNDDAAAVGFQQRKEYTQSKNSRSGSPYLLSVPMQVKLNTKRAYQRVWNDISSTMSTVIGNIVLSLIIGSVFYGSPNSTAGFASKGATLFFAVLLNALTAMAEITSLYAQRPIIEKHASYAFYHPATEAIAGIVSDIPVKFALAVAFNIIMYFLSNLRREPSQFFIYFLVTFIIMFVMSAVFRTMAAITKSAAQAMGLAGILILALIVYTGYVIPVPSMHPWFEWIHYINPIYYAFEILIANEFHGREFDCAAFVPAYADLSGDNFVCAQLGSVPGRLTVSGDAYIRFNYEYSYNNVWRDFGILIAFLIAFMAIYFLASELNSSTTSTAEALVFRRGHEPAYMRPGYVKPSSDEENTIELGSVKQSHETSTTTQLPLPPQQDVFTWKEISYDIEIKGSPRRLLDNVSGWVKPGTLTALMGVSGAGKTTLLDVLAHRTTMGVITGDMFVNGKDLDASFQRKTGYVQQQDLHLETATVRESLRFSALLRQPANVSTQEKYDYVEDVIQMLGMGDFAEAIVGIPGEGLNVEQRKLLTIGVELAAKPKLLLFLDEPTSGLDSQSSWAICSFLRKLADSGQAVLCTIHQPSAILFQEFDQLLFLAKGGRTVYFGPIGTNSRTLLDYFESNGGRQCAQSENPAEYMIEVVNAKTNANGQDWFDVWKQSPESQGVQDELTRIHAEKSKTTTSQQQDGHDETTLHSEFATPFWFQVSIVTQRVFQQYWRMPEYIISKCGLATIAGLFIGFSFYDAQTSLAGMQTLIFSLFMVCSIFASLVNQIMPLFVTQRSLYEVRERPSKAYSWKAFLLANIIVEIPYQIFMGILTFATYYYAVVGASQSSDRQGLVLLFAIQFYIYASTFAQMCIAAMPDAETASPIVVLLFAMCLTFCGVMQPPSALPGFWIFMYRASPFTYWISGMTATQVSGREVICGSDELSVFDPPANQTCAGYMSDYISLAGGKLINPDASAGCEFCSITVADEYLAGSEIFWGDRWRNFGLIWVYVFFNIFMATVLYYVFRVRKWDFEGVKKRFGKK